MVVGDVESNKLLYAVRNILATHPKLLTGEFEVESGLDSRATMTFYHGKGEKRRTIKIDLEVY